LFRALAGVRLAALTAYFLTKHRSGRRIDPGVGADVDVRRVHGAAGDRAVLTPEEER
jgi:hypothetical protein